MGNSAPGRRPRKCKDKEGSRVLMGRQFWVVEKHGREIAGFSWKSRFGCCYLNSPIPRALNLAVFSAWTALLPDICTANVFTSSSLDSSIVLSVKPILTCCSVTQSCSTLWDPMDCSTSGFPVLYYLLEFAHIHWVNNAILPSHPLLPPSPPALNLSQHRSLFWWVSSLHQVARLLELQLQHQSFQWIFKTDFL